MSAKRFALGFAVVVGVVAGGLVGWTALSGLARRAAGPIGPPVGPPPPVPDRLPSGPPAEIRDIVDEAGQGQIVGMDKRNPNRVAYELFYERLEPQRESGRIRVVTPRAWIYLESGACFVVNAESASFLSPPGSREPESGRFTGGVVGELFDAGSGAKPGPEGLVLPVEGGAAPPPSLTARMDSLSFDSMIGELNTPDPVHVEGPGLDLRFVGLRLNVDEPRRQIAFLQTGGQFALRYSPSKARPLQARTPGAGASATGDRAGDEADTWYRAELTESITLTNAGRTLEADVLEIWTHLVNGALPEHAIARVLPRRGAEPPERPPHFDDEAGIEPTPPAPVDDTIVLTSAGPLTLRPQAAEPPELRSDHLRARFSAPIRGVVRLFDAATQGTALCVSVDYQASAGVLSMTGRGAIGVNLTLPGVGEAIASRWDASLATGVIDGIGPITMRQAPAAPEDARVARVREIVCRDRCRLTLATRDGALDTGAQAPLREALFQGEVVACDGDSTVRGESLLARFAERPDGRTGLSRVTVEGGAIADARAGGRVAADRIDVLFDPTAPDSRLAPTTATAEGSVRAERDGVLLIAGMSEVTLTRDDQGDLGVEAFQAEHAVRITRADGLETLADRVRFLAREGVVELIGEPAVVHFRGGSIAAASMRFDQSRRFLTTFGATVVNHSEPRREGGYERAQIECAQSMTYDDVRGVAEFVGNATATARPDDLSVDTATGHRILVDFTTGALASAEDPAAGGGTAARLIRATIFGASVELPEGGPARVESRRYSVDPSSESGLQLERLAYLDGDTIVVEAAERLLRVPGPGRFLLEDRRASRREGRVPASAPVATDRDLRGTTLFEWSGDMSINRAVGEAFMQGRVRMRQRPLESDRVTELECERLDAALTPDEAGRTGPERDKPELLRAEASGAVYATQSGRQLIADRLIYDAAGGIAEAIAAPGNLVTLYDQALVTPQTGSVLRWDLTRDRVEWFDARETTLPR